MNQPTHTPIPWRFVRDRFNNPDHDDKCGSIVGGEDEWFIAEICGDCLGAEANGRLIAAAPDLLKALQTFLAFWDDLAKSNPGFMGKLCLQNYAQWNEALLQAPAAIAKAEGKL